MSNENIGCDGVVLQFLKGMYNPSKICIKSELLEKAFCSTVSEYPELFPGITGGRTFRTAGGEYEQSAKEAYNKAMEYCAKNNLIYSIRAGIVYFGPAIKYGYFPEENISKKDMNKMLRYANSRITDLENK